MPWSCLTRRQGCGIGQTDWYKVTKDERARQEQAGNWADRSFDLPNGEKIGNSDDQSKRPGRYNATSYILAIQVVRSRDTGEVVWYGTSTSLLTTREVRGEWEGVLGQWTASREKYLADKKDQEDRDQERFTQQKAIEVRLARFEMKPYHYSLREGSVTLTLAQMDQLLTLAERAGGF